MGQYFIPVILDEDGQVEYSMLCYDFDSGAKLMEHSWIDNDFVAAFETLLLAEAPRRVVWAGDYADPETNPDGTPLVVKSEYFVKGEGEANLYHLASLKAGDTQDGMGTKYYRPDMPGLGRTFAGYTNNDYKNGKPLFTVDPEVKANAWPTILPRIQTYPYLINWDKKVYVDKRRVPSVAYGWTDGQKYTIHPLPLLTAEGNGRGGGDFRTEDAGGNTALIGTWARDHISLGSTVPEGFEEIVFDLVEAGAQVPA